jgi:hypothetical protein
MFVRPLLFRSSKELSEELKKLTRCSNTIKIYFYTLNTFLILKKIILTYIK